MLLVILGVVVLAVLVWAGISYNRLVTERLRVQTQWSQIDVVLKQRADLIPNLVETVKGYARHEQETLEAVLDARKGCLAASDFDEKGRANAALSGAVGRLMALAEAYPELKANTNFLHLQQELSTVEQRLADYRQFYNDTVLRYNRLLMTIPTNLVAGMFGFQQERFFQAEESEKRNVTISF